ncbi:membrane alanyl aminopeptidase-like [Episyrphus balteatus]|uniref:membrane alanyl aminopeptidase-like n=1 Tax=Episyrphus balteatus TaxID=286459 RepID=UPI002486AC08|nr:membrane alanyl aminopeptidase-like [Episyrphus balteatus]
MKSHKALVVVILFVAIFSGSHAEVNYRLSKDVVPLTYNITIRPYFLPEDGEKIFTFNAETTIVITTKNLNICSFSLHVHSLNFITIDLHSVSGNKVKFSNEYDELTNKLTFNLNKNLVPFVDYFIHFNYTGLIFEDYEGLFRSSYTDAKSIERSMLVTQLQRTTARKLFPCFDEPGFKANFTLHISRPRNYRSFTNTVLLSTTIDKNEENRYIDHFETTPYMSTYLVAMMISEYVPRIEDNISIISRPEFYNKTIFSLNIAKKVLNGYNELFGVPYTTLGNSILQKVSLPKFVHNGMENWGLIIYKDEVLIYEDNNTDLYGTQYSTSIISHETSHSWFGNSITFEWWGYFWLNEAFARYYQYYLTHELFPQYELDKQFTIDQMHSIFDIDASNATQPLSEPNVSSPDEVAKKFSSITYVKGASIVRMIKHAMSESKFVMAIRDYIKSNLSSSVNPSHFLKYLQKYWPSLPNVDVESFFNDWTEIVGFPLLNVSLSENNLRATIQQTRYLYNVNDGSDPHLRYTIPLTYTTNIENNFNNTFPQLYFKKDQQQIVLNFEKPIQWIMFNIQQTGYYRVMYDINLYNKLYNSLLENNWSNIHVLNRAQFVDDLFALGKVGLYKYDSIFKWLEYLETETHYTPWKATIKGLTFIGQFLTTPQERSYFGKYILLMTEKVLKKLGTTALKEDSILDVYNRNQILNLNCKYGRQESIRAMENMLSGYLNNGTMIPVDIRSIVYCNGMRNASENNFEKLVERFKLEKIPREKLRIRNGLGCVRNTKNIENYFELILSGEISVDEKMDAITLLSKENPENVWVVYEMMTGRLNDLTKVLGSWKSTAELVSKTATLLTRQDQRNKFEEFITINNEVFGTSKSILYDALKQLDFNLNWSKKYLDPLHQYLESKFNI